jgi:hypothetical protein
MDDRGHAADHDVPHITGVQAPEYVRQSG